MILTSSTDAAAELALYIHQHIRDSVYIRSKPMDLVMSAFAIRVRDQTSENLRHEIILNVPGFLN